MPNFCMVLNCGSNSARDSGIRFFRVPSVCDTRGRVNELSVVRRKLWISSIRRTNLTKAKINSCRVCSLHFHLGRPAALSDTENPDWVPSLNMGYSTETQIKSEYVYVQEISIEDENVQFQRNSEICDVYLRDDHQYNNDSHDNTTNLELNNTSSCQLPDKKETDEDRLQTHFEIVNVDKIKEDSSSEDLEKVEVKPFDEIDTLRKEIRNLKRKTEEQEQTICKMKALNESLAKDLHNERHRNLYLKSKVNLLEKENLKEPSQQKFVANGVSNSQNQIVLIVTNDEKDKHDQ